MTKRTAHLTFFAVLVIILVSAIVSKINPDLSYGSAVLILSAGVVGVYCAITQGRHFQD